MSGVELAALFRAVEMADESNAARPEGPRRAVKDFILDSELRAIAEALSRRAAPMEAVAWRWRIDDAQCPTWQYGDTRPGLLPAPYLTVQALAVIPAPGKDAVAWRETIARIISIALHGHDESADQREQTIKTATDAILALIPQAEDKETVK